jgi:hypothetical protein
LTSLALTSLDRVPVWARTLPFALLLSCGGEDTGVALPDWGAGYEGDGGVPDGGPDGTADGGPDGGDLRMALFSADDIGIPTRLYEQGTTTDCAIDIDGTREGRQEIICRMEWNELDLSANGLVFDLHVPAGACEWLEYWYYQYEAFPTGDGPATVSYTVDDLGQYTNEVNSIHGEPYCSTDYRRWTNPEWPNCCEGTYVLTVTDAETGEQTTYPPQSWGGRASACYDGAAFADDEAVFDRDGWPVRKYVFLARAAFDKRFDKIGPSALDYHTNVAFANYYDPADHDGTEPAGFTGEHSEPYYNFYCLDHAEEVLGSIRLVVREWNEEKEFDANGDPDTEGLEPGTNYPINDLWDWKDATPGSTTWIYDND